ncbi:MAG: restriction endonuclease subunit S [Bacteroidia bacterium]|nr:restriction endonuclease subunit S [Bacteroidia bacterium]
METTQLQQFSVNKSGWTRVKFGDVVFEPKETVKSLLEENIEHVVGLEHIDSENIHLTRSGNLEESTTFSKKFKKGDVLFGRRRAYLKKAAVASFDGICSGDITVFRAKKNLLPELLPFVVNNEKFFDYAVKHSAGGLSPRVKFKDLANYEFLLPPKDQQAQLAELLWAMDEVVEREREVLERFISYIESLIHSNLSANKGNTTLGDYCENDGIRIGPFGSLLHAQDYVDNGVPVIMPTDIIDGEIQEDKIATISNEKAKELNRYCVIADDIIFPRRGDLSKRAIINKKQDGWICGTGSIRVRLKENLNSKLAYYALTSRFINTWLLDNSVGTTMPNLNASTIGNIPLSLPEERLANDIFNKIESAVKASKVNTLYIQNSRALQKSLINQIF